MAVLAALLSALLVTGEGFADVTPAGATSDTAYLATWTDRIVGHAEPAIRHALFQTVAIVTTTGYASLDFNAWSQGRSTSSCSRCSSAGRPGRPAAR